MSSTPGAELEVQDPEIQDPEVQDQPDERDWETEARKGGWCPEDEWRGGGKWLDAKAFVERGEEFAPFMKGTIKRLKEELRQKDETFNQRVARLEKVHGKNMEAVLGELDRRRDELKALRKQAVKDGDGDAFDAADTELEDLNKREADLKEESPPEPEASPIEKQWLADNDWYGTNTSKTGAANAHADRLRNLNLSEEEFFQELTEAMKRDFPDLRGENRNRGRRPKVESPSHRRSGGKHSFDSLPQEAKDAYYADAKRFKAKGREFTKERYVQLYYEDEE